MSYIFVLKDSVQKFIAPTRILFSRIYTTFCKPITVINELTEDT